MVLSSALPPIEAKLVQIIRSDQYVAMKELMADNMHCTANWKICQCKQQARPGYTV